jgi:hypothetical protein
LKDWTVKVDGNDYDDETELAEAMILNPNEYEEKKDVDAEEIKDDDEYESR